MTDLQFKKTIKEYYSKNRRSFPWRETSDAYHILVSEIMLQQTQVSRVIEKYNEFIAAFPTVTSLSKAQQSKVLSIWKGLGYNRRALHLKKAAEATVNTHKGVFPKDLQKILALPGVGQSTAGALLNFAFNIPTVFIETNIRATYLYFYFKDREAVSDAEILPLIKRTLDTNSPRDWFYALYDFGTHLKSVLGKKKTILHKKSKSYKKQSPFKGSSREVRSRILSFFLSRKSKGFLLEDMSQYINMDSVTIHKHLCRLQKEGFIDLNLTNSLWRLKP